jgi:epoxyqueuosine reductase
MAFSAQRLTERALELGFNLVGLTPATPSPTLAAYTAWVEAGMHGSMGYMARPDRQARRADLNVILPGVRSLVVVGLDYRDYVPTDLLEDPSRGRFASYAWGLDYHDIMTPRLEALADWLRAESGHPLSQRVYVDTGPLLERSHAYSAGLGFVGKNTMLIHPRRGSYFFLGEILTDLEFSDYDTPGPASRCGSCTRCLAACPTDAFPRPYVLDARRCISALTIEHKGWIDASLRPLFGNWVYGCDVCQDVCPWQRFAPSTQVDVFHAADADRVAPRLLDLLSLGEDNFRVRYEGSAVMRIKRERLVRNACIAAGNWRDPQAAPLLNALLDDASPLVRGHAAWALARIEGADAAPLRALLEREADEAVRAELAYLRE